MNKFFEKWLSSILLVITIMLITFLNTRASESSVDDLKTVITQNAVMIQENGKQIALLTGYIKAKAENK